MDGNLRKVRELENEINALSEAGKWKDQTIDQLRTTNDSLGKEFIRAEQDLSSAPEWQDKLEKLEKSLDGVHTSLGSLDTLRDRNRDLEEENQKLRSEVTDKTSEFASRKEELEKTVDHLNQRVRELVEKTPTEDEERRREENLRHLQEEVANKDTSIEDHQRRLKAANTELEALRTNKVVASMWMQGPHKRLRTSSEDEEDASEEDIDWFTWTQQIENLSMYLRQYRPIMEPGCSLTREEAAGKMYPFLLSSHCRAAMAEFMFGAEPDDWFCFQRLAKKSIWSAEVSAEGVCPEHDGCLQIRRSEGERAAFLCRVGGVSPSAGTSGGSRVEVEVEE
ncbi:hypothetical protein M426DRAFT_13067 [Hypoxylon sp. CI-4A]|nr:hypothetical protein M426DRAFT_13067 [Hypoxylon sp. CI-4A]